ncbi:OmpA family protein, partial [Roseomonas rosea]
APARTYLVFFDFDRADLTDRARQIIADAAQAVTSTGTTRIEVAGHADRSGTPQYNQRLSMRRAEAVAAELSRRGIARNQMSIQAFGESRPLVPTADGVREPQNRRVEIVLR